METDISIVGAAGEALVTLMDPFRLLVLFGGVVMGLMIGIIPGIGGIAGMALLLPFTYAMDSYAAFALLLGMSAVTGTSDTIPAVLFGVPGSASAQATVMDGYPMAKKGEAGRALSAAYTASLIGGLIGAILLAFTIPVLRPIMLHIGSPELLAMTILGISMVAVLSGIAPLRGLIAAGIGILLSMIGADARTGTLRWTMDTFYLWDGLPLVPMLLGLFALPEIADLAIKRQAISGKAKYDTRTGMLTGVKDVFQNWWLVIRCGALGAGIGAIPGLGSSVVDWLAYGYTKQTTKDADKTFGKGDVRGVIGVESATNSINAGSLVPTVAFGVPGSSSMAILLSVFLIHGLVPGPEMVTTNLNITYSMVWSIAIANILGAGLCFLFSGQLAKIALLRYTLILPTVMVFVYIGSFQASRAWGDLYTLLLFAVIGWIMKQLRWPRPPLILGFVLGVLIERYMFISVTRYGLSWLTHPIVTAFFALALLMLVRPMLKHLRVQGGVSGIVGNIGLPRFEARDLIYLSILGLVGYMLTMAMTWPQAARLGPMVVGIAVFILTAISFANAVLTRTITQARIEAGEVPEGVHMDTPVDWGNLSTRTVLKRAGIFLGYFLTFMALVALIGFIPTVPVFVALYMWFEGRENWKHILGQATVLTAVVYVVFDRLLMIPWPQTVAGQLVPLLRAIPSV